MRGIMLIINRPPVGIGKDEGHYEVLVKSKKDDKNQDTPRNYVSIPTGSTVVVQCEDGEPWTHITVELKATIIIMRDPTT